MPTLDKLLKEVPERPPGAEPKEAGPLSQTVREAQRHIWRYRTNPRGVECPCCGRTCKIYRRVINRTQARWLLALVAAWRERGGAWISVHDDALKGTRGGDYSKLRHWGLIEPSERVVGQSPAWRPTERGALFADGELEVPRYAHIYMNRLVRHAGQPIRISAILKPEDRK